MRLDLQTIRAANVNRQDEYKNAKGEPVDHRAFSLSHWGNALAGEVGEACNLIKKIERGDFSVILQRRELGKELADVLCYVDILAEAAGIDLTEAYADKFNLVSARVGAKTTLVPWCGEYVPSSHGRVPPIIADRPNRLGCGGSYEVGGGGHVPGAAGEGCADCDRDFGQGPL